ncbi:hypothetical protein GYMLUDRAFT_264516 [Collybiopsis luxurians FD-317 M1]|uniref:Phosphatidylserine decarboxylase n=1 Tax=Collybiopsis luxurians FD-317 M1 TaxID=944289 RepID=A0A0D0BXR3_9AGAR|nr:hypothetical protein GYMLUDRAFT_264516 [Collybiopsis luxurians FD-317 M1]
MASVGMFLSKLAENPDFQSDIETAFNTVKSYNLKEFEIFGINTFPDWLKFIDNMIKWRPTENEGGSYVYMGLCLFYIILDEIAPTSSWAQNPIDPSTNPSNYTWLTKWIIGYAKEIGSWMDSPASLDKEYLKSFYNAPRYHMQDYEPWPGTFTTFNEFFRRPINPAVRPIASPNDQTVITNPADCTFSGFWPVDSNGEVTLKSIPWSINQLLNDLDEPYKNAFAGGCFTHSFLNTTDYHRQHAPCDGAVVQAKVIEGIASLQVIVVMDPVTKKPMLQMHRKLEGFQKISPEVLKTLPDDHPAKSAPQSHLDAPDQPGYQFLQARALVLIDNPVLGLVACMPIGMAQISSVVLSVDAGNYLTKGQEMSFFKFGGSDIVMVFQEKAKVQFTAKYNQ